MTRQQSSARKTARALRRQPLLLACAMLLAAAGLPRVTPSARATREQPEVNVLANFSNTNADDSGERQSHRRQCDSRQ